MECHLPWLLKLLATCLEMNWGMEFPNLSAVAEEVTDMVEEILPLPNQNLAVLVWIQQVHICNTPQYIIKYNHMLPKVASTINLEESGI